MPRSSVLATVLLVAACGGGGGAPDAAVPVFHGGSITPDGCSYTVTTRDGAEAPEVAPDELGDDPTPRQVRLGLAGDPMTTMVIDWRTTDETTKAGVVRWGEGAALDNTTTGLTFGFESGVNGNGGVFRMHEAHLCGLVPDTQYSYQVGSTDADGVDHFSDVYTFRTAPDVTADPTGDIVIGVMGDSRGGYDVQAQLVQQIAAMSPDLLLFSGDAVTLGPIQPEWDDFFDALEPLNASVPMVVAHGNHEVNAINYYAQLALPGDEEDFGLDYGWAHLTVLNDSPADDADVTGKMTDFLKADLTAHDGARWKLVMHHRPAYTSSTAHAPDPTLQATLPPLFDAHGVDLVLNGHNHDYERSKPLYGGAPVADPASGTVYIVDGGLGAELYDTGTSNLTEIAMKIHSAFVIRLSRDTMSATVFDPNGATIDTFSESKPPPP
jgi:Calcineurin-like phosphoesterase/Purple acid Phosphatase, N-terminal domain